MAGSGEKDTGQVMTGSCYCGAVSFTANGPSKWCAHCHCTICRRIHGAGAVTWVGFEADRVEIIDPASQLHWYASTVPARRGSCRTCGSQMFFRSPNFPGELHIVRAAFTGPVDRQPQGHAFADERVEWLALNDHLDDTGNS